ncbi:MAG: hypothetical protein HOP13_06810 [Alphaproteobacteria bacterium]|nr:hypothetical protein [Alphaproteobacteria bacterium]
MIVRWIAAFLAATAVMVVLGSLAHSLMVQQAWIAATDIGDGVVPATLSAGERSGWILHDLTGMLPLFGGLAGVALLVAFLVGSLVARFTGLRPVVFAVAGATAIFVLFTVMKMTLGTVGVFGARGTVGLGLQVAAGLIAGLVFAALTRSRAA